MSKELRVYEPLNFLSVDIKQAGSDLIECVGEIRAREQFAPGMTPYTFRDIEKAVAKAARAVANYKRAIDDGRRQMTRDEFEGLAAKVPETSP